MWESSTDKLLYIEILHAEDLMCKATYAELADKSLRTDGNAGIALAYV